MNALEKALTKMPELFSSYKFCDAARGYGITQFEIRNGIVHDFLLKNCIKLNRRAWQKKEKAQTELFPQLTEEMAVNFLKSKGYKIMKPVTDWQEL